MSDEATGQEVGGTDRFEESTNLQYGVVEATIDEADIWRPDECHIVLTEHDDRYWLTFHAETDMETTILFDDFDWRAEDYSGSLYLKQTAGDRRITVAIFDWHIAFPRDGFGLVGEWFLEQINLDQYRARVPCPRDECDGDALHTGLASVCDSPDCDFYVEGHIEAPHEDQQKLKTDGGKPIEESVSQPPHCSGCGDELEAGDHAYREEFGKVSWTVGKFAVFDETGGIVERHWCQECYNESQNRDNAALYDVTDGDRLWNILEVSDGKLVADLRPMLVGGRSWIRVADGDVECVCTDPQRTEDGIYFGTKEVDDFDVSDFGKYFDDPTDRTRVALKPAEETPFAEEVDDGE